MRGAEAATASGSKLRFAAAAAVSSSVASPSSSSSSFFLPRSPAQRRRQRPRAATSAVSDRLSDVYVGEAIERASCRAPGGGQLRRSSRVRRASSIAAAAAKKSSCYDDDDDDDDDEDATSTSTTSTTATFSFPSPPGCCSSRLVAASVAFLSALSHAPEALAATATTAAAAAAPVATSAAFAAVGSVAEGGPLPPALLEALSSFLQAVEDMGPAGAGVFAATVALAELVPLLPTTPLALASGLLFGAAKGALLVIAGNLTAATLAFYISRGIGARFAKRMVAAEGGDHGSGSGEDKATAKAATATSGLAARFASVTAAIEAGTPVQKFAAVFALRATPVVPFSASNYALGLSPISFPIYITATALGGSVWASVYASLGAASRALLARGAAIDVLVADLLEQATSVADDAATGLVLLSVGAAAGWGLALAAKAARAGNEEAAGGEEGGGRGGVGAAAAAIDSKDAAPAPVTAEEGKKDGGGDERPLEALRE